MLAQPSFEGFIGTTLGGYRLEQILGRNELGPVFLGSTSEKTKYLLRFLIAPAALSPEARMIYLGRFQQLSNQVTELQHRHILPLLDYGTYQGMPYLVTPYMPMQTLIASIAQRGPLDLVTADSHLTQLASALEYAHQHAIIHRNLTTDCVFILRDGRLVIGDFGVMRMLELCQRDGEAYPIYGSGEGRAPEQILGKPIDTYTDVYALGAVLYRLLTAHSAFRGNSREEIAQQHLHTPIPSLSRWRSGLPAQLDAVIGKAMAKDPAQRFQRPGEFAEAYHTIVIPGSQAVPAATGAPPIEKGRPREGGQPAPGVAWPPSQAVWPGPQAGPPQGMSPMIQPGRQRGISRRRTLWYIAGGGAITVGVALAIGLPLALGHSSQAGSATQAPSSTPPARGTPAAKQHVVAHTRDIPLNSAAKFPLANSNNPGIIVHLPDNRFVAFDSTCTHAGCSVDYIQQMHMLKCPCHDALFDPARNAAVVQGPAPTPLAPLKISVNADGTITQL